MVCFLIQIQIQIHPEDPPSYEQLHHKHPIRAANFKPTETTHGDIEQCACLPMYPASDRSETQVPDSSRDRASLIPRRLTNGRGQTDRIRSLVSVFALVTCIFSINAYNWAATGECTLHTYRETDLPIRSAVRQTYPESHMTHKNKRA